VNRPLPRDARLLALLLRGVGALDACAMLAVLAPLSSLAAAHARLGLGTLPDAPVVEYLIRATSALYAVFGIFRVFISFDVRRYWPLVGFLNWVSFAHGAAIIGIGVAASLPWWWPCIEGAGYFVPALAMLFLYYRAGPPEEPGAKASG
jgi:hypothetical protein